MHMAALCFFIRQEQVESESAWLTIGWWWREAGVRPRVVAAVITVLARPPSRVGVGHVSGTPGHTVRVLAATTLAHQHVQQLVHL